MLIRKIKIIYNITYLIAVFLLVSCGGQGVTDNKGNIDEHKALEKKLQETVFEDNIGLEEITAMDENTKKKLNFNKQFSGKINNEDVVVNVDSKKGQISGSLVVKSSSQTMAIKGNVNDLGEMSAVVGIHNGLTHVIGAGIVDGVLQGYISDPRTNRTDVIVLDEAASAVNDNKTLASWDPDPGQNNKGYTIIVWQKTRFDNATNDSIAVPTVNYEFISSCDQSVRAVLGLMSRVAGVDDIIGIDSGPSINYSDVRNLLIEALGFSYQGSSDQMDYLRHWFRKDSKMLKVINEGYYVSYGANSFRQFDYINIKQKTDTLLVEFAVSGLDEGIERKDSVAVSDIDSQNSKISVINGVAAFKMYPNESYIRMMEFQFGSINELTNIDLEEKLEKDSENLQRNESDSDRKKREKRERKERKRAEKEAKKNNNK